jgi:Na+-transporting NADH:ubiquinone oxidoreductase subunit C
VLGIIIAITADNLRERQEINEELDIKKNILYALGYKQNIDNPWTNKIVESLYNNSINEIYLDRKGTVYKKQEDIEKNPLKIYQRMDNGLITGYAIPIEGKGLWGTMYGYFAIEPDAVTVKGITFYRHKETPGLGGEVDKDWFKNNFIGKRLVDNDGKLVSIEVIKGFVSEKDPEAYRKVDGISGATITGKGVTNFLKKDLDKYEPYFKKIRMLNEIESL